MNKNRVKRLCFQLISSKAEPLQWFKIPNSFLLVKAEDYRATNHVDFCEVDSSVGGELWKPQHERKLLSTNANREFELGFKNTSNLFGPQLGDSDSVGAKLSRISTQTTPSIILKSFYFVLGIIIIASKWIIIRLGLLMQP
jgi:hypothetical protein